MRMKAVALLLGCLVLGMTASAFAALGVRMPLSDLVANADAVVRGTIAGSKSYLDDKSGRIYTRHTLQVSDWLRGSGEREVTVVTMGGELEDLGQLVPGEARFFSGEEVVLCLKSHRGHFVTMGMAQGKFRVEKAKGQLVLVRDLSGIRFLGEKEDGPRKRADKLSYSQFLDLVKSVAK